MDLGTWCDLRSSRRALGDDRPISIEPRVAVAEVVVVVEMLELSGLQRVVSVVERKTGDRGNGTGRWAAPCQNSRENPDQDQAQHGPAANYWRIGCGHIGSVAERRRGRYRPNVRFEIID